MVKTKARASLIQQLDNPVGLASQLTSNHVNFGDWRQMFRQLDEINRVTADDVQRVAREYFRRDKRTVTYSVKPEQDDAGAAEE